MFFQNLDKLDLLKNTIAVTNDYGGVCGAYQWNHKKVFHEETVNVPFVIFCKEEKYRNSSFAANMYLKIRI